MRGTTLEWLVKGHHYTEALLPLHVHYVNSVRVDPNFRGRSRKRSLSVGLTWVTAGVAVFGAGAGAVEVSAGQVLVRLPGGRSGLRTRKEGACYRRVKIGGLFAVSMVHILGLESGRPLDAPKGMAGRIDRLKAALEAQERDAAYRACAALFDLLLLLGRGVRPERETPGAEDAVVRRAVEQMWAQHADPNFGISELARALDVSPAVLRERFHAATGESPKVYLDKVRTQRIMQLLAEPNLPIRDIAQRVGFKDSNYMAKFFVRRMQVTPSTYRRVFTGGGL